MDLVSHRHQLDRRGAPSARAVSCCPDSALNAPQREARIPAKSKIAHNVFDLNDFVLQGDPDLDYAAAPFQNGDGHPKA